MVYAIEYQGRLVFAPITRFGLHLLTFPDFSTAARIAALAWRCRREYRLSATPLATSRFHVSLLSFGEFDERETAEALAVRARDALANFSAAPFVVMLDRVESFSGRDDRYPLVLRGDDGVVGLEMLYQKLGIAMCWAGLKLPLNFTPHLTLSYDNCRIKERFVGPISWTVREFELVLSLVGKTKYDVLGRWQLRG
jgi:RNA 2',3'-cyclic 3'-phosphodiesterase